MKWTLEKQQWNLHDDQGHWLGFVITYPESEEVDAWRCNPYISHHGKGGAGPKNLGRLPNLGIAKAAVEQEAKELQGLYEHQTT